MQSLDAQLISSNADEVTAKAMQHPVLVRLAKLEAKSASKPGTRIKVRAGMYLYTATTGAETFTISEEQNFDGTFSGNWEVTHNHHLVFIIEIKTLKDAIERIEDWAKSTETDTAANIAIEDDPSDNADTAAYIIAAYYISRSTVADTIKFAEMKLTAIDADVQDLNYARCTNFNTSFSQCIFDQLRHDMYAVQAHWSEIIKISRNWNKNGGKEMLESTLGY